MFSPKVSYASETLLKEQFSWESEVLSVSDHVSDSPSPYSIWMQLGKAITLQAEIKQGQPLPYRPGAKFRKWS